MSPCAASAATPPPALELSDYALAFATEEGPFRVLDDVSLQVGPGEVLRDEIRVRARQEKFRANIFETRDAALFEGPAAQPVEGSGLHRAGVGVAERDRGFDLAVLQAIGWRARTLLGLCMTEVLTRGVLALGLAAALAPWLARWLLGRISHANHYHMELLLPAWVFLAVCACALVLMPLSAWPAWRAARRVTPARALRILARE